MSEQRWALLRVRLETLRDAVAWLALVALLAAILCGYSNIEELRRFRDAGAQASIEWHRYVSAAVNGAGVPLMVGSILLSTIVLLTAGMHVASVAGDSAHDEDDLDEDEDSAEPY